jgi:Cu-processing system permease protein
MVYDGIVLLVATTFAAWPLEGPLLVMSFLNPVDLARILLLMQLDISALMGYTGAVYERFFTAGAGAVLAAMMLLVCAIVPLGLGYRWFKRKDF